MENEITLDKLVNMTYDEIHAHDKCDLFYDWFCRESSLPNKAKSLLKKVQSIVKAKTTRFEPSKCYVFFKNNCTFVGGRESLNDDFRICDLQDGNVLFTVNPRDPAYDDKPTVWSDDHGFALGTEPLKFNSWSEVKKWFATSQLDETF